MIRSLCVYCGSKPGRDPRHSEAAAALGTAMGHSGVRLVYGGGSVGLMGVVADAALAAGGDVLGVIPAGLFVTEIGHQGLTELVEVGSMHERKARMAAEADAFVALPGGLGTLEELAEMATWAQLGIHAKPVAVLDLDGFWSPLLAFLDSAVAAGYIRPEHRALVTRLTDVEDVLPTLSRMADATRAPVGAPMLGFDES
ncbi:MAG: TIGR00730 family Rossman fold protein [Acidimicrobiia bacterium]